MAYKLVEVELSKPLNAIELAPEESGVGLIARWRDRLVGFEMIATPAGSTLSADQLLLLADQRLAARVLIAKVEDDLARSGAPANTRLPSLSIAICTKDRAERLSRLLKSLDAVRKNSAFASVEIVVVDNASTSSATREAVECFDGIRYVFERKAGLDF